MADMDLNEVAKSFHRAVDAFYSDAERVLRARLRSEHPNASDALLDGLVENALANRPRKFQVVGGGRR